MRTKVCNIILLTFRSRYFCYCAQCRNNIWCFPYCSQQALKRISGNWDCRAAHWWTCERCIRKTGGSFCLDCTQICRYANPLKRAVITAALSACKWQGYTYRMACAAQWGVWWTSELERLRERIVYADKRENEKCAAQWIWHPSSMRCMLRGSCGRVMWHRAAGR